MHNPSDVFGSLISETEDFLEDLHNRRDSPTNNKSLSPPFSPTTSIKSKFNEYTDQELAFLEQRIPSPSESKEQHQHDGDDTNLKFDNNNITYMKFLLLFKLTILFKYIYYRIKANKKMPSKFEKFKKSSFLSSLSTTPTTSSSSSSPSASTSALSTTIRNSNSKPTTKTSQLNCKQNRAFEQLDKMMEEILENDISGMCPFNFRPPPQQPTSSSFTSHKGTTKQSFSSSASTTPTPTTTISKNTTATTTPQLSSPIMSKSDGNICSANNTYDIDKYFKNYNIFLIYIFFSFISHFIYMQK